MKPAVTLYYNPRCSKSREAVRLLESADCALTVVRYLDTPLSRANLRGLADRLPVAPQALVREADFAASGLIAPADDAGWLTLLAAHPHLLQRPIVTTPKGACIAHPLERVLSLLAL